MNNEEINVEELGRLVLSSILTAKMARYSRPTSLADYFHPANKTQEYFRDYMELCSVNRNMTLDKFIEKYGV